MREIFGDENWLLPVDPKLPEYKPPRDSFKDSENIYRPPDWYKRDIEM